MLTVLSNTIPWYSYGDDDYLEGWYIDMADGSILGPFETEEKLLMYVDEND